MLPAFVDARDPKNLRTLTHDLRRPDGVVVKKLRDRATHQAYAW